MTAISVLLRQLATFCHVGRRAKGSKPELFIILQNEKDTESLRGFMLDKPGNLIHHPLHRPFSSIQSGQTTPTSYDKLTM